MASKKETFMQGVVTVMFSQILIKILGLIIFLNKERELMCFIAPIQQ